ncbi:hypothetical protein VHEMI09657 [[Torrubiella] hemipterigena]|uniref:Uncharacterized protein n=1 Tax=[Torrubiella] hemipterigena TaxID=1531966 RepID=A0A0A1TAJ2_9HYPO|nr:hypothetical protein VHEMI09657 [[Torrubiella] hemipterigena]
MGSFDWLSKVGATPQAVATLNDQPDLFVKLILVLVGLGLQCLLIWYIHYATLKPSQRKKKDTKKGGAAAKPAASAAAGGGGGAAKEAPKYDNPRL